MPLARLISLGILTVLIVALGITFYQVLAPFLLPLFLAWVAAILCRPLYLRVVARTNGRPRLAAGLTTLGLLLVVLLPLVLGTVFAAAQLIELATTTIGNREWRQKAYALLDDPRVRAIAESKWVAPYLAPEEEVRAEAEETPADDAYETPTGGVSGDPFAPLESPDAAEEPLANVDPAEAERLREAEAKLARERFRKRIETSLGDTLKSVGFRTIGMVGEIPGVALGVLGRIVSLLVALVMFAIGLYYFLCDGPALVEAAEGLIPVRVDYQREILHRFDQVVRAVVLSTFLSALAQGLLTAAALGIAGFDHLLVLFVVASLSAMIPLAGTWLVWAPCAVWLAWHEHSYGYAAFLTVWGLAVVGTIDNVIRTYVLNSSAKLHPLLAFVSVLGGLQVMGLWGVFIAPVVAACLHALIQIFNAELKAFSHERIAVQQASLDEAVTPPVTPPPEEPVLRAPVSETVTKAVPRPVAAASGRGKRRKR
jgi:predicted PurR-regulated permease PerM